jgi:hypothetical protein
VTWSARSRVLQCHWESIAVCGQGLVIFHLPAGNCVDMAGCIQIAEMLDPYVLTIATVVAGKLDTSYVKTDEWRAWTADQAEEALRKATP